MSVIWHVGNLKCYHRILQYYMGNFHLAGFVCMYKVSANLFKYHKKVTNFLNVTWLIHKNCFPNCTLFSMMSQELLRLIVEFYTWNMIIYRLNDIWETHYILAKKYIQIWLSPLCNSVWSSTITSPVVTVFVLRPWVQTYWKFNVKKHWHSFSWMKCSLLLSKKLWLDSLTVYLQNWKTIEKM